MNWKKTCLETKTISKLFNHGKKKSNDWIFQWLRDSFVSVAAVAVVVVIVVAAAVVVVTAVVAAAVVVSVTDVSFTSLMQLIICVWS